MQRVPFAEVMKGIGAEEVDEAELDRPEFWADQLEQRNIQADPETVRAHARTFRELERLVKALDTLETIASIVEISAEYVPSLQRTTSAVETNDKIMSRASPTNRDFWGNFGEVVKAAKENVSPLLKGWLMVGVQGKILQLSGAITKQKLTMIQTATKSWLVFERRISQRRCSPTSAPCTLPGRHSPATGC